jgi:hypothetical protein
MHNKATNSEENSVAWVQTLPIDHSFDGRLLCMELMAQLADSITYNLKHPGAL